MVSPQSSHSLVFHKGGNSTKVDSLKSHILVDLCPDLF